MPKNTTPSPSPSPDFPIVGIGASAGGLEAIETFFQALPADLGMAYVVITHTDAGHKSLLAELLAKYTAMPVIAVTEAVSPRPDHVYVALPGNGLIVGEKGLEPSANVDAEYIHTPIDRFFKTLAEARQELAVGVIFSGALNDGTEGLRAIKQHGGLVLVQEPATAGFDGMPRSAIAGGMVDLVLPVAKIPAALGDYRRYLTAAHAWAAAEETSGNGEKKALHKVLAVLKVQTGYDFYHYQSGQHLLTLVNDVLDLARIEAGRLELNPEPFHPAAFLEDIRGMFTIRARSKGLTFDYQCDNSLPVTLHGDPKRLRQILINLLANAVKYTEQGSVSLRAAYVHGCLHLSVQDTGSGIPAAYLDKIFQPFCQVENASGCQEGVGLGLAISRTFVELMDGTIQVDSTPGQGSVFRLQLPLPADVSADRPRVEIALGTRCTGYRRLAGEGPFRVVVTDDMADNRLMLAEFLKRLGFEVIQAADGSECLHHLQRQVPDLVLLDLVMPSPDGLEVVKALRRQPACAKLPVIAVSALAFEKNREQALAAGCTDFIAKPLNFSRLLEQIGKYLPLAWEYLPAEG